MRASILEADARAGDEVFHRARHQHLACVRARCHASAYVHGETTDVRAHDLALAGVQPRADLQPDLGHRVPDRHRAADTARRAVEGGEEAVASSVDLASAEVRELPAD